MEKANFQKWIDASLFALALLLGYFFSFVMDTVWVILALPYNEEMPIQFPAIIGYGLGLVAFLVIRKHKQAAQFFNEVALEASKVVWPGNKETAVSTVGILVMILICTVLMFTYDSLWGRLIKAMFEL